MPQGLRLRRLSSRSAAGRQSAWGARPVPSLRWGTCRWNIYGPSRAIRMWGGVLRCRDKPVNSSFSSSASERVRAVLVASRGSWVRVPSSHSKLLGPWWTGPMAGVEVENDAGRLVTDDACRRFAWAMLPLGETMPIPCALAASQSKLGSQSQRCRHLSALESPPPQGCRRCCSRPGCAARTTTATSGRLGRRGHIA